MADLNAILSSDRLPTLPAVALKVLDVVREPCPDVKKLIAVIRSDPALAAKIVQVSHSSLFAIPRKPTSIEQAVPLLGVVTCSAIVLSFSLISKSFEGTTAQQLRRFWQSSLTQAVAAENLARKAALPSVVPAECFVVGLLQDIGSLALLRSEGERYGSLLDAFDSTEGSSLVEMEQAAFGFSHVDVSTELCRRWHLSDTMIGGVNRHHMRAADAPPLNQCSPEMAVGHITALAAAIGEYFCRGRKCAARELVESWAREDFSLTGEALHAFLQRTVRRVLETAEMFSCDARGYASYEETLSEANAQLSGLAIRQQVVGRRADEQIEASNWTIQELQNQLEQAKSHAHRDALTGVYNRRFVDDLLPREHERCLRYRKPLGLAMLDLDGFKKLNDFYGHLFGDAVLREVASCLEATVRSADLVARIGGDEFLVLLVEPQRETFRELLERIEHAISDLAVSEGDVAAKVRASIGGVYWQPQEGAVFTVEQLIDQADRAMYRGKQRGGELVIVDLTSDVPAAV